MNALANRCLTQSRAVVALCELGLYDDAYALARVLIEATVHIEFLTHSSDWPTRIDTYAHFLDAYQWKKFTTFSERLRDNAQYENLERRATERRKVVEHVFGRPNPLTWRIFPTEAFPAQSARKKLKPTTRLVELTLRDEYDASLRQMDGESDGEIPFLLDWVYFDSSSYVHTDVASLIGTMADLELRGIYDLKTAAHPENERHAMMIATAMALSTLTAVQQFTGVSFGARLDQLASRLRVLARTR